MGSLPYIKLKNNIKELRNLGLPNAGHKNRGERTKISVATANIYQRYQQSNLC